MRETLGEFEQLVVLAILQLNTDVYAARIVGEIERRTGRSTAPAAVYITLRRLEEKRLVESWLSEPTCERGGKSRRCVSATKAGVEALRAAREANDRMWKGLEVLRKETADACCPVPFPELCVIQLPEEAHDARPWVSVISLYNPLRA